MHADEVDTSVALVRRLLAAQFPRWAALPVAPVPSAGTDNALFRLGAAMVVRLPRVPGAALQVEKEQRWLPELAPHLPLEIPTPLALGQPDAGYPWRWSVYRWLRGEQMSAGDFGASHEAARALAGFVLALQRLDPAGGPSPGAHNAYRGVPLARRDADTRTAIAALRGAYDAGALTAAWEAALGAPLWTGPPVWLHGDLLPTNLLAAEGRLTGVVDFGLLGVGDPACDAMAAWTLFSAATRKVFRVALGADDATWARGRGWALSFGLIALPYYEQTNPVLAGIARRAVEEALADHARAV